jgi:hypothetical protein
MEEDGKEKLRVEKCAGISVETGRVGMEGIIFGKKGREERDEVVFS